MASYLTPDWLMSDINQLLRKRGVDESYEQLQERGIDVLSKSQFEDKYSRGSYDPMGGGRQRHWFDYDYSTTPTGGTAGRE